MPSLDYSNRALKGSKFSLARTLQWAVRTRGQVELWLRLHLRASSAHSQPGCYITAPQSWGVGPLGSKGHRGKEVGHGSGLAVLVSAGFGDRLLSEVKKLAPKDVKIKVKLNLWGRGCWVERRDPC